jgi:hypothetical protein
VFLTVVVGFVILVTERVSERLISFERTLVDLEGLYVVALDVLILLLEGLDGLDETEVLVGPLLLILLFLEPPPRWAIQTVPTNVKTIKKTIFFIII